MSRYLFLVKREVELSELLDFTKGVPSHFALERVFCLINPVDFNSCFMAWTKSLNKASKRLISVDGKIAKNSYDSLKNTEPLYLVNAWASEDKVVLAQIKTKDKGNELAGVNELLAMLEM